MSNAKIKENILLIIFAYFPSAGEAFPGALIDMFPPQLHIHLQLLSSAGELDTISLPPGAHGAAITGMHGIGVRTPIAAAVAEATVGLDID